MFYYVYTSLLSLLIFCSFSLSAQEPVQKIDKKLIGIIMPMQHAALDDMVRGFQEELAQVVDRERYNVLVVNAQGDASLQMALIKNLINDHCTVFVPIGTATTQMTLQLVKQGMIVALAAKLAQDVQKLPHVAPVTGVLDEVSLTESLEFLKPLFPGLSKFTVIHSGSEKIHEEIESIQQYAKENHLTVQILMAQTITELATAAQNIDEDSEFIFVLKDHLIVSGINLLIRQATSRKIPLIASDEGSVKNGAAFALGVQESEIGRSGARLVSRVLDGTSPRDIPIRAVKDVQVFVNLASCNAQGISTCQIKQVADQFAYGVSIYSEGK